MKKGQKILIVVFAIIIGLFILKDPLIKTTITSVGSGVVGAPIKIRKFSLGLFSQKVHIKDFRLYNPKGFPKGPMVDVPEILVQVDMGSVFGGKLHLPNVVFNLKEMVVVKNKDGQLNVDALKVTQQAAAKDKKEKPADAEAKPKKPSKEMALQIDQLKLNVERVVYKDYTKEPPAVYVYEVALKDKTFKDIKSAQQLATLIMVQAMGPTAIQGAKVYAAATILGVGFLPAGIAGVLLGDAEASAEYTQKIDKVYSATLDLVKTIGELKSEDQGAGVIKAKVDGADVTLKIAQTPEKKTSVSAVAKKLMIPKQEIAQGVIYQISEKLK